MDEIEQLVLLTGKSFEEQFEKGLQLGKPLKSLCWILAQRTNPNADINEFGKFNITQANDFLKGFLNDPKGIMD
jgi:hypothetical protein